MARTFPQIVQVWHFEILKQMGYKTELIRRRGPWRGIDDVEYGTLEWVDWFNHHRLLEPIGDVPPAEFEAAYYRKEDPNYTAGLREPSLR